MDTIYRLKIPLLAFWCLLILFFSTVVVQRLFLSDEPIIDNSVSIWFDAQDPELATYESYNDAFGQKEWTLLLLQTPNLFSKDVLIELQRITKALEGLPNVAKVTSIANVRDNRSEDDSIDYFQLLPSGDLSANDLQKFESLLRSNPIFDKNLIKNGDNKNTVVLIQNHNAIHDASSYRLELVNSVNVILADSQLINDYALAGTTVVNAELNRTAQRDVIVFYILVSLSLALITLFIFRSWQDLVVLLFVVVGSVLPTMGMLALLSIPFNMVTVMLPTILIALSVAAVVHVINEFHENHKVSTAAQAADETLKHLWRPCLWATLTTVVGLSSFAFSQVKPMFQLGVFSSFGMILTLLWSLLYAPLLLRLLWSKPKTQGVNKPSLLAGYINFLRKNRRYFLGVTLLLILPIFGLHKITVDTNYVEFFTDSHPTTEAYKSLNTNGFSQNPMTVELIIGDEFNYSSKGVYSAILAFEEQLRTLPAVNKLISVSDFLRQIDVAFNGNVDPEILRNYNAEQVRQMLFLGELSGNDDIADLATDDYRRLQLLLLTDYLSSTEQHQLQEDIQSLAKTLLPSKVTVNVTGTTSLWANMDMQVSKTQILSIALVGCFLAILLPLILKSWLLGLITLMINVIPLAITLGLMALLGVKVNLATALIGGIALGIVVDDSIHFMNKFVFFLKQGLSVGDAVDSTLLSVGKAIGFTTLILCASFACMMTSQFLPSVHFSVFISTAIVLAFVYDMVLLPIILKYLEKPIVASMARYLPAKQAVPASL